MERSSIRSAAYPAGSPATLLAAAPAVAATPAAAAAPAAAATPAAATPQAQAEAVSAHISVYSPFSLNKATLPPLAAAERPEHSVHVVCQSPIAPIPRISSISGIKRRLFFGNLGQESFPEPLLNDWWPLSHPLAESR